MKKGLILLKDKIINILKFGFLLPLILGCNSGCDESKITTESKDDLIFTSTVISSSYIGNGVQWGGYDVLNYWIGSSTLSDSDWNTLFKRVSFLRPPLVRIMISDGWNYIVDGNYDPTKSNDVLVKILDFCQENSISVMFGEWGHQENDAGDIDSAWIDNSTNFLEWLIDTKNYSCIKYLNLVNEPNGYWSSIEGDYDLWVSVIKAYYAKLVEKNIASKIKIIGPDIAIWSTSSVAWISNTNNDLGNAVGAYDIHTYPDQDEVRDGTYQDMIGAYQKVVPSGKAMIMGELGFKYDSSSDLGIENEEREDNDPYASDDCNMFVYDAFYGVDMADAIIQNMSAAYSGVIVWNMDDAMYNIDGASSTKLKRWGFWNILGAEKFENQDDENIRPWFFPISLLCRYFPAGTIIYDVTLPDKKGLRAIVGKKDGKYTMAIVNSGYVEYDINLKMENGTVLNSLNAYRYISGEGANYEGETDEDGFAVPYDTDVTFNFSENNSEALTIESESFYLFTNME